MSTQCRNEKGGKLCDRQMGNGTCPAIKLGQCNSNQGMAPYTSMLVLNQQIREARKAMNKKPQSLRT